MGVSRNDCEEWKSERSYSSATSAQASFVKSVIDQNLSKALPCVVDTQPNADLTTCR